MNQPATQLVSESPAFDRGIRAQMEMTRRAVAAGERQAPAGRRPPGPLGAPRPVREAAATPGPQRGGLGRLSEKSGASRARTGDLVHAMHALSQLSYGPKLLANSSGEIESVVPRDCPRTGTVPKNGSRFGAATGTVPFGDSPSDYAVADAASTDTEGTSPHSSSSR